MVVFGAHHASNILPKIRSAEDPKDVRQYQAQRSIIVVLPPADLIDLSSISKTNDHVKNHIAVIEKELLLSKVRLAKEYLKKSVAEFDAMISQELFEPNSAYSRFSNISNQKVLSELREDLETIFKNENTALMTFFAPYLGKSYLGRNEMAPNWVQEHLNSKFRDANNDKERSLIIRAAKKLKKVGVEIPE